MIVITGATGALNGTTLRHLLHRVPGSSVVAVTRNPEAAGSVADLGVTVRYGDYSEPASLPAAFAGADQLLLVSSNDPHADTVTLHRRAIEAAVSEGVGRVLYTSHQCASPDTPFDPGRIHFATEQLLARSGLAWTSLRNGFYVHSLEFLLGDWRDSGLISVPADGPVSWTSRADEGEAAAVILASDTPYDGPVTLTANAAPTFTEIATIAADALGRPMRCEVLDPDEWFAARAVGGQDTHRSRFMLGTFEAAGKGDFAGTAPLLGELLGREPASVHDYLVGASGAS